MKIHYSPYFDRVQYIDFHQRNNLLFNEKVVGSAGLLSELELRGGFSCECLSEVERQANYYNAVKIIVEAQKDCFIKESFKIDEYGVATELLHWRDELVIAGWNPGIRDISVKLDFLSDVERQAIATATSIKGESDRWRAVIDSNENVLQKDDELIIHFPEKFLPPYMSYYIKKLIDNGLKCSYRFPDKSIANEDTNLYKVQEALLLHTNDVLDQLDPKDNESFRILRFDRQMTALEWVVTQNHCSESVFINSDNRSFDNVQLLFGSSLSGSSFSNSNPEIVQLFKLGCSLFIRPLNVYNLLSYLQISRHPLPFQLRQNLIKIIIAEGGVVNPEWGKVISEFIADGDKGSEERKKDINTFLPLGMDHNNDLKLTVLQDYVMELRTWTSQTLVMMSKDKVKTGDEFILQQLSSVINFCNAFLIIINGQTTETISNDKLKSWILSIYKPTNYSNQEAQKKSHLVIESPAAFVDPAKEVIWIDCYNGTPKATIHKFLNAVEKEALKLKKVLLWSEEDQVKAQLFEQKMAILSCRSIFTLIISEKDKGEKLNTHPVIIQLSSQFENLQSIESVNPIPEGEFTDITKQDLPGTPEIIEMGLQNLFTPREKESYSSIWALIQNPLDYVLTYQAGLSDSSVIEMSDEKRTMGNVAHLFIEKLVLDSEMDLLRMKQTMVNNFQNIFDVSVLQKGAILLLDENRILLTRFAHQLKQSVNNLLNIIENNGLKVIGCEVSNECQVDNRFLLTARIDMLLIDMKNRSVIFDMKWTSSKKYYNKLITENRALQLEIYKEVLKKAPPPTEVSAVGYFDLSHGILETIYDFLGGHINIIKPENSENIFEQALNSYSYRWKQLQKGTIEVAEKMPMELLAYNADCVEEKLYPLETDYKKNDIKTVNDFTDFQTFKGGLL
ncbi:MAG TPA: PD-(D/E)XK nuclease family protein [Bacteroidales bacterium]|nr:PD-(D/E)XK nuclease family protein [Bacteroidales bacterium]